MASRRRRTSIICTTELNRSSHDRPEDLALEELEREIERGACPNCELQDLMVSKHPVGWLVVLNVLEEED